MRARVIGVLLGVVVSTMATAVRADEKAEGVLLGLRGADDMLVTALADAHGIQVLGAGVAIPRHDGWWRADERLRSWGTGDDSGSEESLFIHPSGTPIPPVAASTSDCAAQSMVELLFISPDAFAVSSNGGGMCDGAAHPFVFANLGSHRYGGPCAAGAKECVPYTGAAVSLAELLGPKIGDAMNASAANLNAKDHCISDTAEVTSWGPIRSKGRWIARAMLEYESEACREAAGTTFTVAGALPPSFTGHDALPMSWEAIAKDHAGAVDAVASPSGALLVVVDAKGISVFAAGKLVGTLARPKSAIVMAQWALGRSVERWRKEAAAALH